MTLLAKEARKRTESNIMKTIKFGIENAIEDNKYLYCFKGYVPEHIIKDYRDRGFNVSVNYTSDIVCFGW